MGKAILISVILLIPLLMIGCKSEAPASPEGMPAEDVPAAMAGPGGCTSQEECIAYCSQHREECTEFDRQKGIGSKQKTEEPTLIIPSPPTTEIKIYKGFWMPAAFYYGQSSHTMTDISEAKNSGANIISIGVPVEINSKGEVRYPTFFGNNLEGIEKALNKISADYYSVGIKLSLAIEPTYMAEFSNMPSGEPQPFPTEMASKEGFLRQYNQIAEEISILAEKYHVEMFSPMNEPDRKLGIKLSSQWGQEILPIIKKNYHGKIVFKGDLNKDSGEINFKGYDAIGFSSSPGGQGLQGYEQEVKDEIDRVISWSARDAVPQVIATEFGCWGGASRLDDQTKAQAYKTVFDQAKGKINGFIAFDPPSDQGWSLKNSPQTLGEIKNRFKEI